MENNQTPQENNVTSPAKRNSFAAFVMPIISLLSLYVILSSTISGRSTLFSLIIMLIFPAAYCTSLITARSNTARAIPLLGAIAAFLIALFSGAVKSAGSACVADTLICASGMVAVAAFMFYCCIKKHSKTVMLIGICVVFTIMVLVSLCVMAVTKNGYFSPALVIEEINSVFRTIRETVLSVYGTALSNEEFLNMFKTALSGVVSQEEITKETLMPILETGVDALLSVLRSCLPAIIALVSMMGAFVIIAFLGVFAKSGGIALSRENEPWEYTVSGVTARVFNAAVFIAILGSIIRFPAAAIITSVNLVIMLTPLLDIIALKSIYRFMKKRGIHPFASVLLMIVGFVIISGIVQVYSFVMLAFVGVYIVNFRERIKLFEKKDK